ncbi:radical SAM protein [Thermosulfuriphilus sp.]
MSYVFGPVKSRRLGLSLGLDLVPSKVCSFDCLYCEVGRTSTLTCKRSPYISKEDILKELKEALKDLGDYDVITFTGSGEPTLNTELGELVEEVKKLSDRPLCLLTNSSLFTYPQVRDSVAGFDILLPSLDAATEASFRAINRPAPGLKVKEIIEGLIELRREFSGEIWLEVLLVSGINDSPEELESLAGAASAISPERIQINTVARPPAESWIRPVAYSVLEEACRIFGPKAEIIVARERVARARAHIPPEEAVLEFLRRRPADIEELAAALGYPLPQVRALVEDLTGAGRLRPCPFSGRLFYCLP